VTKLVYKTLIACLILFSVKALAANPGLDWKTHESQHFLIHYPASLGSFVSKVERLAENSHGSLSDYFQWAPKNKTHVLLSDDSDQSNGYAQPMPSNTMTLFVQPPTDGELLAYDDWLKMLIHHEYTHILHMDKVLGFPSFLRSVFGRIFFSFPNTLHPNWFAEGLATYQETDTQKKIGRGQSDLFEIMMRTEVGSGIKNISRINTVNAHDWPLNTAYLYGVYFFKFIHDVYGEQAIKALIENYSDNTIPYQVGSNSIAVTGKSLSQLWPEFNRYLKGYFSPQIHRINKTEESKYKVLSSDHGAYGLIAKGGLDDVWYSAVHKQLGPHLYRSQDGIEESIVALNSLASIDVSESGSVLISQLEHCGDYGKFYDLYLLNPTNKNNVLKKITSCSRYRLAKWIGDDRILALRYSAGKPFLDLLNISGQLIKSIWEGDVNTIMSGFDVSDSNIVDTNIVDGVNVVATIKFGLKHWNLFKLTHHGWQSLTQDFMTQTYPIITGDDVMFIQSQSGQSEIHHLSAEGTLNRLSHSYTGVKQFVSMNDGDLVGLRYSPLGYQVIEMASRSYPVLYSGVDKKDKAKDDFVKINLNKQVLLAVESPELKNQDTLNMDRGYLAYRSLWPTYWFPIYFNDSDTKKVGFLTSGSDALNIHAYNFQLSHEAQTSKTLVVTDYIYDNRILLGLNQDVSFYGAENSVPVYENSETWFAGYVASYLTSAQRLYPYIAVSQSNDYLFVRKNQVIVSNERQDNWLAVGVTYEGHKNTLWSGDTASGWQARLTFEDANVLNNNVAHGNVLSGDVKHYFPLKSRHTLAQRLFVAYGFDSDSLFQLGGTQGDAYVGPGIQIKQRSFPLRGFSKGLADLTGTNVLLHSVEYRLPVNWQDTSYMAPPIGLSGWSLRGFVDTGSAWNDSSRDQSFYTGVGAEAVLDSTLGYYLGLRVRIGMAKGLSSEGEETIYMELGGSF
jgi:hypothetical protein